MNIAILGAAGFIGTNLTIKLAEDKNNIISAIDIDKEYFRDIGKFEFGNVDIVESTFDVETNFDVLLNGIDIVYHLFSSTVPTTSNQKVTQELVSNVITTSLLLEACVRQRVKKVVFVSSGGTVYGKETSCPLVENTATNPISSYGVQKVTIEKLLYLYWHMYGIDYRIIRLANPYGPYQRPNGVLGAVTTFTYKALKGEEIIVYGDGTVIRDFIYIDDAISAILKIVNGDSKHKLFNLGVGYGVSINQVLDTIAEVTDSKLNIMYRSGRDVDVPINFLDIGRYERAYGKLNPISLKEGIGKMIEFMKVYYDI